MNDSSIAHSPVSSTCTPFQRLVRWNRTRRAKKVRLHALKAYLKAQARKQSVPQLALSIRELEHAIASQDEERMRKSISAVCDVLKRSSKKSWAKVFVDFFAAILIALLFAAIIRQVWFELYEIPTGSMRPTFQEQDRVLVSKSPFGLNIPFYTGHFLFSPQAIDRGSIAVITGDRLDLPDVDTMYFWVFPGKRRYVKRVVAKPGDWVYFYGGDIFSLDRDRKTIRRLKEDPRLQDLEYIPFIHFDGITQVVQGSRFGRQKTIEIKQMNIPVAKIEYAPDGTVSSFVKRIDGNNEWIPQFSELRGLVRSTPQTIGDFWGIKNFAKAKLLLPEQLPAIARKNGYGDPKALVWLELHHSPTLPEVPPSHVSLKSSVPPITTVQTWIPLREEHCDALVNSLYTARFVVDNGRIHRYHYEEVYKNSEVVPPKPIEDGIYEFYHGTAYAISSWGTATPLPEDHPIYPKNTSELSFWYNLGIDMNDNLLATQTPTRYAYFKDGDLLTMGHVIVRKNDPILLRFHENEINRQVRDFSYFAFQDYGSPIHENDPSFFQSYGLKIPDNSYLLLGDNHAMSLDSRYFGTVPECNIQGSPVLLFWPFGPRWGNPLQPNRSPISPYSVSILVVVCGITLFVLIKNRMKRKAAIEEILNCE